MMQRGLEGPRETHVSLGMSLEGDSASQVPCKVSQTVQHAWSPARTGMSWEARALVRGSRETASLTPMSRAGW